MSHNTYLPLWLNIALILLMLFGFVLAFVKSNKPIGATIAEKFNHYFYEDSSAGLYQLLFIVIWSVLFIIFSAPTHFLGDGYTVLANIASDTGTFHKWSEKGITIILTTIQSFFGGKSQSTALIAFQIVSVAAGIISIYFYFLIAGLISDAKEKRIIIFAALLLSGTLLMFFGYVENYPLLQPACLGFLYFGILFLKQNRGFIFAFLFLIFGSFIHLQMIALFPVIISLPFLKSPLKDMFIRNKFLYGSIIVAIVMGTLYLFVHKYTTNLYFENMFLPLFKGKPFQEFYYLLSPGHLLDAVNQYLLLSPALIILLIVAGYKKMFDFKNGVNNFLLLCTFFLFLFLFTIDPKLGMIRDWDLFALSAIPLTILLGCNMKESYRHTILKAIPVIIIFLIISVAPFLYVQLNGPTSLTYIRHLTGSEKKGGLIAHIILREYYENHNMIKAVDSLQTEIYRKYPNSAKITAANKAMERGNIKRVEELVRIIRPDKFNTEYYNIKSALHMYYNRPESAVVYMEKAVELKNYNSALLNNLAFIYTELDRYDEALDILFEAYALDNSNYNILTSLVYMLIHLEKYDRAIENAEELYNMKQNRHEGSYLLAKIYTLKNMKPCAEQYYKEFMQYKTDDREYNRKLRELDSLLGTIR